MTLFIIDRSQACTLKAFDRELCLGIDDVFAARQADKLTCRLGFNNQKFKRKGNAITSRHRFLAFPGAACSIHKYIRVERLQGKTFRS